MELSRVDETELLVPLHEGVREQPRWATFLSRLRRRTRSDRATLLIGAPSVDPVRHVLGAVDLPDLLAEIGGSRLREVRPGRVYAGEDLIAGARSSPHPLRLLRMAEPGGAMLWLAIERERGQFGGGEGALLGALAPHLAVVLRTAAELARDRAGRAAADHALARAGVGWLTLDADARVVEIDAGMDALLGFAGSRSRAASERLLPPLAEAARALQQACTAFADDPAEPPRLIRLDERTPLDLLARPLPRASPDGLSAPVLLGVVRTPPPLTAETAPLLSALLGLSPVEGRLALALARGRSIVEAGLEFGLTEATVRNYSKALYAKTHTRGQAELVARVLTSVAVIA